MNIFIPPIADIIRGFLLPDYRGMFDAVMRDLNWCAGHETTIMIDEELIMIRVCPVLQYSEVLKQIDVNYKHSYSRFFRHYNG